MWCVARVTCLVKLRKSSDLLFALSFELLSLGSVTNLRYYAMQIKAMSIDSVHRKEQLPSIIINTTV